MKLERALSGADFGMAVKHAIENHGDLKIESVKPSDWTSRDEPAAVDVRIMIDKRMIQLIAEYVAGDQGEAL